MPDAVADFIRQFAVAAIPIVFGITLHEISHGWMARHFGDRTAERLGRLSLNPLKHVDPIGSIVVPVMTSWFSGVAFGWAKPVPIDARALRNPKRAMIAVAAAGPAANLLMAIGWALSLHWAQILAEAAPVSAGILIQMSGIGIFFNVLLCIFNLIPVPPLDGGRVLRGMVSESFGRRLDAVEPYGLIILTALLILDVFDPIRRPLFSVVTTIFLWMAGVKGS